MRSEYRRESKENTYSWIEPLGPSIIDTPRLIWPMDLLLKKGYNVGGRVAGLELGDEWIGQQILPRAFLVHFQRVIDDRLKIGRRGGEVRVRHKGESEEFVRAEGMMVVGKTVG